MNMLGNAARATDYRVRARSLALALAGLALWGCSDEPKKVSRFEEAKLAFARGDYDAATGPIVDAAERGDPEAESYLASMYAVGMGGIKRNRLEAYKWFSLAIHRFSPSDSDKLERAKTNRDAISGRMPPNEIAEGEKFVREWKPK